MDIEINSIDDFIILIENELKDAVLFVRKEVFDSSVINNSNQEYLDFYKRKKKKIIKKFGDKSFLLRIEFKNEVEINKEDLEQLIVYPKFKFDHIQQLKISKELFNDKEVNDYTEKSIIKEQKELQKFFLDRLNDLRNSIKLSYYNLRIETLFNNLDKNEQTSQGDLVFLNNDKIKSELFFNYLVDKWLRNNEPKVKTALKHITFKMYYKNSDENKNTPFKIRSSLNDFAIYWNKNFNEICELNPKNPHLNIEDLTSSNYYSSKFDFYLHEFTRG
ncbi:hypothetical protein [Confluentibacter flavum]|uniref:Uncharacterized protein n=1 Tax=Confluentibacter flavum TaxID=1909700 RepID=A0A2N3HM03_9FLAO|nr:hypothetical protein [Confluentibacter flavum]PKQ45914.1 hypothetical protein CSW08_05695 [Confluentibacter flavum]